MHIHINFAKYAQSVSMCSMIIFLREILSRKPKLVNTWFLCSIVTDGQKQPMDSFEVKYDTK